MKTLSSSPRQMPLPGVDNPAAKLDLSRRPDVVQGLAELLLQAARTPFPEPREEADDAR